MLAYKRVTMIQKSNNKKIIIVPEFLCNDSRQITFLPNFIKKLLFSRSYCIANLTINYKIHISTKFLYSLYKMECRWWKGIHIKDYKKFIFNTMGYHLIHVIWSNTCWPIHVIWCGLVNLLPISNILKVNKIMIN